MKYNSRSDSEEMSSSAVTAVGPCKCNQCTRITVEKFNRNIFTKFVESFLIFVDIQTLSYKIQCLDFHFIVVIPFSPVCHCHCHCLYHCHSTKHSIFSGSFGLHRFLFRLNLMHLNGKPGETEHKPMHICSTTYHTFLHDGHVLFSASRI